MTDTKTKTKTKPGNFAKLSTLDPTMLRAVRALLHMQLSLRHEPADGMGLPDMPREWCPELEVAIRVIGETVVGFLADERLDRETRLAHARAAMHAAVEAMMDEIAFAPKAVSSVEEATSSPILLGWDQPGEMSIDLDVSSMDEDEVMAAFRVRFEKDVQSILRAWHGKKSHEIAMHVVRAVEHWAFIRAVRPFPARVAMQSANRVSAAVEAVTLHPEIVKGGQLDQMASTLSGLLEDMNEEILKHCDRAAHIVDESETLFVATEGGPQKPKKTAAQGMWRNPHFKGDA